MNALITADSIYTLLGDDPEWRHGASTFIMQHLQFVLTPDFPCEVFEASFLRFVRVETQAAAAPGGVTVCPSH